MDFVWSADASGIPATIFDAKGDIIAASAADTAARLAVGANGTVLTADSAEATGLKWATPSAGTDTWTLLSTTTLSGAATRTVSSLSSSKYYVQIISASSANPYAYFFLRFNSDSGNNYPAAYYRRDFESSYSQSSTGYSDTSLTSNTILMGRTGDSAGNNVSGFCEITNCTSTSRKTFNVTSGVNSAGSPNAVVVTGQGFYTGTSAITSISLESSSGDFDNGTMYIYGA